MCWFVVVLVSVQCMTMASSRRIVFLYSPFNVGSFGKNKKDHPHVSTLSALLKVDHNHNELYV